MGIVNISFSLDGFKKAVQEGVFQPDHLSFGYVDGVKFEQYQKQQEWKLSNINETFDELQQRMSRRYFKNVMLAQNVALDYASLQFPAYSMLITEDMSEDWLAIVDFHKKHSRDHSLHQPLTAYIAATLLGCGEGEKSLAIPVEPGNLLDYCVKAILTLKETAYIREIAKRYGLPNNMLEYNAAAREFWKDLFYRTVVLSALFHDIGYPWQFIDRIGTAIRKNASILYPVESTVIRIVDQFKDRMVLLPVRHYMTEHVDEPMNESDELKNLVASALSTHGFPGAVAFLSLNDTIKKYPADQPLSLLHEFSVEWAAMGIFMHDMAAMHKIKYPKLRVNIMVDPLSAIISLADYLEEFNRPKVQFRSKAKESRMKYYSDCSEVEISSDGNGILTVSMKYNNEASKAIGAAFKKDETEDYFDLGNGYEDLEAIGIKKVEFVCGLMR